MEKPLEHKPVEWRLKKGHERRWRSGHPWVYSNELSESPAGITPGACVRLCDSRGNFEAWGYGNPGSLIAFRSVSRAGLAGEKSLAGSGGVFDPIYISQLLKKAWARRINLGWGDRSFRWFFGEADGFPGLIIDRYLLAREPGTPAELSPSSSKTSHQVPSQVIVVQFHTAGAERWVRPRLLEVLQASLGASVWSQVTVVIRDDVRSRKLEGLTGSGGGTQAGASSAVSDDVRTDAKTYEAGPRAEVLKWGEVFDRDLQRAQAALANSRIVTGLESVSSRGSSERVSMTCDLLGGQKTGFFLDQSLNANTLAKWVRAMVEERKLAGSSTASFSILDICCYVGQWSTQAAAAARGAGAKTEVALIDASAQALEIAAKNVGPWADRTETFKGDIRGGVFARLGEREFDVVICDPPALVQGRRDLDTGAHAYLQLNTDAIRRVKPGGLIVTASCSGLMEEERFTEILAKAEGRAQKLSGDPTPISWFYRGYQGPDHPILTAFPEGRYLKLWIGRKSEI